MELNANSAIDASSASLLTAEQVKAILFLTLRGPSASAKTDPAPQVAASDTDEKLNVLA